MSEQPSLDLEGGTDAPLAGARLHRLEVFNWGTFDQRVWSFELGGRNALLTGDIGSGKSTLVDALTTLLVPAHRVAYNKAAGADTRERSLRSYVLGHYKSERHEVSGAARPVALRDTSHYAVILGVFHVSGPNENTWVTLAQMFWFKEPQGQPARLLVVAERELSISEHFAHFGGNPSRLRKRLRALGCTLHESFPPYGNAFRRLFGIEHEQALELFHQTVSMKSVGNLTDFVRTHMLEPFEMETRIKALIGHVEDLDRAHQAVLKAKRQMQLLEPLVENCHAHAALAAEIEELNACHEALRPYFARLKSDLLARRLEQHDAELARLGAKLERLDSQHQTQRRTLAELERAQREAGGERLEQLAAEIQRNQAEKSERQLKAHRHAELLARIGEQPPEDETRFLTQHQGIGKRAETLRARIAELNNSERDEEFAWRKAREEHAGLSAEIDSLKRRKSNIDRAQIAIRATLCAALDIPETDLPFAGELIQVREDERDWEGAAERLLRSFGLSLLVPDAHYRAVSDWVNAQHLGARLVYYQVRPHPANRAPPSLHPQSLVRKLAIKPDSPLYDWLERTLQERFDLACCESGEAFRREGHAITREGQIKGARGRHEKDDRFRLEDRSRYVLGWSNADKLRALIAQGERQEARIGALGARLAELQSARRALESQLEALARLEEFGRFAELDWRASAREIQRLEDEHTRLASASDVLRELREQIDAAKRHRDELEAEEKATRTERGRIEGLRESVQRDRVRALEIWRAAPPDAERAARLEQLSNEALSDRTLTVDNCDKRQDALEKWLQERIRAENKTLSGLVQRIINQMARYRDAFKAESAEMDAHLEAAHEYERQLDELRRDDLPRFEARFKELLNVNTINEIANFNAQLMRERETIHERIARINQSLQVIDYNPGRYIALIAQSSPDSEIRDFQRDLRACIEGALSGSEDAQYSEARFLQVKAIIDRLRGREGLGDQDKRWRAKVTDVRNWFLFSASERWREDDAEHEHYSDSGGKSGGQKEKLAYTVLAASLAYQFGLEGGTQRTRSFRFVVIDEAFGRGSDESARYGLRLFEQLDLQLLIVTPLQKIHIIEPFVASLSFVHSPEGRESRLRTLSIAQYQAEKARAAAASSP